MAAHDLSRNPIHLGLGATAEVEPTFDGDMSWYEAYGARRAADGDEGRLVSTFTFESGWDHWEMHPRGAEVVICTTGRMTLSQEDADGATRTVTLGPGEYAINAPGVWHTADTDVKTTGVFITAGAGTEHRPR